MANEEKIIGEEQLDEGLLKFGETSPEGQRFESFTPITSESLEPATTIDFNEPAPSNIFPVADLEVPDLKLTEPEKKVSGLGEELRGLRTDLIGQSAERTRLETEKGLPELEITQTDLSSQLKALQAEAKAIPLQIQQESEGRGRTRAGTQVITDERLRRNAIQALTVSSLLEASRGNIALAQNQVDRAVAQKFDPIREEIAVKQANLQSIIESPEFSLADKNRANKQMEIQRKREKEVAKEEADELEIKNLSVEAANAGATAQQLRQIQEAKTPEEALQLASGVLRAKTQKDVEREQAIVQREFDRDLALKGYNKLAPDQLAGLTENDIVRVPNLTGGVDIYKKPEGSENDDIKFVSATANQPGGFANLTKQEFTPIEEPLGTAQPTGQISTININGRDINLDNATLNSLDSINTQAQNITVDGKTGFVTGAVETSTFRTAEQQNKLFQEGKTPLDGINNKSKHQTGMAVDLFPDQEYIAKMKPIMEANGWFQTAGDGDLGHFEFQGAKTSEVTFPTDEEIENLNTEERNLMQSVMRLLPTKLKDAILEKKERQKEIVFSLRQGKGFQEIADELEGFIIAPEVEEGDRELAKTFRAMSAGTDVELKDISASINLGKPTRAMIVVENANLADAQGELSEVAGSRALITNANRVLSLLKDAPVKNLGQFDGKKFKVKRFAGLSDKETQQTQQLETAMVNLLNEIRRKSLGTAVTESEIKFLQPLLTDLLDQPGIISTKMNELKTGTLNVHNQARGTVNLPTVNEAQLLDNDLRLGLYRGQENTISDEEDAQLSDDEAFELYNQIIGQ